MASRLSSTDMPLVGQKHLDRLAVGSPAPSEVLLNDRGEPVKLSDFWASGPTLLTFLRHFGCIFCREWLSLLNQHQNELSAAGLQIVAVGLGEPKHAQRYCGRLLPDATCLIDETALSYGAYGLTQGSSTQLASLSAIKASIRALARGNMQGKTTGDARMLPGTFIIDPQGTVQYSYYSEHAGDHPSIEQLIAATKSL